MVVPRNGDEKVISAYCCCPTADWVRLSHAARKSRLNPDYVLGRGTGRQALLPFYPGRFKSPFQGRHGDLIRLGLCRRDAFGAPFVVGLAAE